VHLKGAGEGPVNDALDIGEGSSEDFIGEGIGGQD